MPAPPRRRPMPESGQNEKPPFLGLCQLPSATHMPPSALGCMSVGHSPGIIANAALSASRQSVASSQLIRKPRTSRKYRALWLMSGTASTKAQGVIFDSIVAPDPSNAWNRASCRQSFVRSSNVGSGVLLGSSAHSTRFKAGAASPPIVAVNTTELVRRCVPSATKWFVAKRTFLIRAGSLQSGIRVCSQDFSESDDVALGVL